ncbi:MAG: hypothetical protein ABIH34_01670, partial [Nanoarchaeota archaeon]
DGTNLHEYDQKSEMTDSERVEWLSAIGGLDIIIGYLHDEFKEQPEAKNLTFRSRKGLWSQKDTIPTIDRLTRIYEKIILPSDAVLKRELIEQGVVDKEGIIKDRKALQKRYDQKTGDEYPLLGLLGSMDIAPEERFLANQDAASDNVMVDTKNRAIPIDFEEYGIDAIYWSLARRIVTFGTQEAGIPKTVGDSDFYETIINQFYKVYQEINSKAHKKRDTISFDRFKAGIYDAIAEMHIRSARRFLTHSKNHEDGKKLELIARANYTAFENILQHQRKGSEEAFAYTRSIYGKPLDNLSQTELAKIADEHGLDLQEFMHRPVATVQQSYETTLNDELRPQDLDGVLSQYMDMFAERIHKTNKQMKRNRNIRIVALPALALAVLGLGYATITGKLNAKNDAWTDAINELANYQVGVDGNNDVATLRYDGRKAHLTYDEGITDNKTAAFAALDQKTYDAVMDGIEKLGTIDWGEIREYIWDNHPNLSPFATKLDKLVLDSYMHRAFFQQGDLQMEAWVAEKARMDSTEAHLGTLKESQKKIQRKY